MNTDPSTISAEEQALMSAGVCLASPGTLQHKPTQTREEAVTLSSHPNDFQHPTRYEGGKTMIHTPHLQLLPIEQVHIEALLRTKSELAALLQVTVPDGWPHFPEAFSLSANESHAYTLLEADWGGYFFLHRKDRMLVGHGAFKGPPDDSGTVEIGYEIAFEYWNRGLATEAAQGMIAYAFSYQEVRAVIAHTLAQTNASNRVLQKVGMQFMAEVDDPGEGKVWRWQIKRDEYQPA
jgi:ribosomal-protein-alanine N-acetyltransferase